MHLTPSAKLKLITAFRQTLSQLPEAPRAQTPGSPQPSAQSLQDTTQASKACQNPLKSLPTTSPDP